MVDVYDDPRFRAHDAGAGHPERPARLDAIRAGLAASGVPASFPPCREATEAELLRVHTRRHLDEVAATAGRTVRLDPDTQAGPHTWSAALAAAGAVTDAVLRLLDGDVDRAFCNVRPPGHHAEADRAMGFCYFNNVAVAAAAALARGVERVLIVDFDVHHGNGTQAIFYDDPRVLYVSSHAYPFYPGTGALDEAGRGAGRGFTVNLPLPAGCGDAEYLAVYREVIEPVAASFDPQLVIVSAGFDAHEDDPLAGMRLTAQGFAQLTASCLRMAGGAAGGRMVMALEGGYDLAGLTASADAALRVLGGAVAPETTAVRAPGFERFLEAYRTEHGAYWPALRG